MMKLIIWEHDNVNDRGAAMIIDYEVKMMLMIGKPLNWPRVQIYFSTLCHNPTRRQRGLHLPSNTTLSEHKSTEIQLCPN